MERQDFESLILYYGRASFFHSMQKAVLDGLARYPTHMAFRLFNGFSLVLGNRVQEGIRELNALKNDSELGFAAAIALLYAHKRCSVVDEEAVAVLEKRINEVDNCTANAVYMAAVFYFLTGRITRARECVDEALKIDSQHVSALVLKAWTELTDKTGVSGNIMIMLEQILGRAKNIDASLALVRFFQIRGQYESAITALNKVSVRFPELNIPLIEKMETQLAAFDWDRAFETSLRILNLEPTNLAALRIKALHLVAREGNMKAGISTLQQLLVATERIEVGNCTLLLQICQLFSRICSRNSDLLALTLRFIEKITQLLPSSIEFITELGNERLLLGNIREASICFRSATKVNGNYFDALCGLTWCQLMEQGASEQTRQEIELLNELCTDDGEAKLLVLQAKIASKSDDAVQLLIRAVETHMRDLDSLLFGPNYVHRLDPEFLLLVVEELMRHAPVQVRTKQSLNALQDSLHIALKHCIVVLDAILRSCPGHINAIFMRAKIYFLCDDIAMAVPLLQRILGDIDETYTEAHLLLAEIQIQQQQFPKALQSLELALSHNFAVRENPRYYLLLGIAQRQQKQLKEAQKCLQAAMHLLGSNNVPLERISSPSMTAKIRALRNFTVSDKVTLYLELIGVYKEIGDAQSVFESERLLQSAMDEFNSTSEEGRLVIAHAQLMQQNSNVSKAIELLSAIQPGQSYYLQARTHLANIYLEKRGDRFRFARCFKELVEACPQSESYLMLAEAYISIQEPDLAVEAYRKALEFNPHSTLLASKLGRAYVKTHQYAKAIEFYRDALKNKNHTELTFNLAEIYLKLKQYKNAEDTLREDLHQKTLDHLDTAELQQRTKRLLLLARVYEKSGDVALALQTLADARDNQYRIQKRISVDRSGNLNDQQKVLSKICLQMAQHSINLRNNDEALAQLKECLKYTPNDIEILSCLGRLHMQMNSMDLCRDVCLQILQLDSNNETASVMMADLSFRKVDFESAIYHFSQLLTAKPCYWMALARLVEVMRRAGTLPSVAPFLRRAVEATPSPDTTAGLNYCKGLYNWYSGNPNAALRNFNAARRDHEWGQQAIFNMVEICINPDKEIPNADIQEANDSGEFNDSRTIALRTAERLLKELQPRPAGANNEAINHRMLRNFVQLASKQKFQIESALQDFTELANCEEYRSMVGPLLGMATALVQLKHTQRAKNHLKRVSHTSWNFEEAEYLERSWLLLADIYINANKLDVAESLVGKVLNHNKSCAKAYELAGYIAEKSQLYRDAAQHYSKAWNCNGRLKPHIGYKVAYNHMKSKHFSDAIEVCQQVLKLHPDYTIIRKDILDKCRNNLRP